jgi:hypothetical protein
MRVAEWNPNKFDREFDEVSKKRLVKAAKVLKAAVRRKCPVGTASRPMYRTGPYKGLAWTSRDNGRLRKSVRVVERKTKTGRISKKMNVRVYVGHYTAYYADIVEYSRPFMRPAFDEALPMIQTIIGVGKQIGLETSTDRM